MHSRYKIGNDFIFDAESFQLKHTKKTYRLSKNEVQVLVFLCQTPQKAVLRKMLIDNIWENRDSESSNAALNKSILLLRRKFDSVLQGSAIETIPRVGYILSLTAEPINEPEENEDSFSHIQDSYKTNGKYIFGSLFGIAIVFFAWLSVNAFNHRHHDFKFYTPKNLYKTDADKKILEDVKESGYFINFDGYSLLSDGMFSTIKPGVKETTWSKVYFLDKKENMKKQILCALSNSSKNDDEEEDNIYKMKASHMANKQVTTDGVTFYSSCINDAKKFGYLFVANINKKDPDVPVAQYLSFYSKSDTPELFRIFRAGMRKSYDSGKIFDVNVGTIRLDHVDGDRLNSKNTNEFLSNIIDNHLRTTVEFQTIDSTNGIYIVDSFGGIIIRHPDPK
ncbi:TPA: winged helix-turn-helix domain-containing protein [Aeromonas veronii]|nr:winged helix-turn-helix domain-containing protein [Aeromonas veronii]